MGVRCSRKILPTSPPVKEVTSYAHDLKLLCDKARHLLENIGWTSG
jgi:hypothetical protein